MITARGFDLANYFWEFCTDYDSSTPELADGSLFPAPEQLVELLRAYSDRCALGEECDPKELAGEVSCYLPLVHFNWGLWGLIKAAEEEHSKFDYLKYAVMRLANIFQAASTF